MSRQQGSTTEPAAMAASPVHRAVWGPEVPLEGFDSTEPVTPPDVRDVMDAVLATVRRQVADGTVYGPDGIVSERTVADLATAGYWGLRVPVEHGGAGATFTSYAQHLTDVLVANTPIGSMGSAHAALGPVTSLIAYGTAEQRGRLLPVLARGARLGAFASTEPGTSSDLRAITTEAVPDGDHLLLTGEKLLITNAAPGRLVSVLCRVEGDLRMLMVELPESENDSFRTRTYGLQAVRHLPNHGLVFDRLAVPAANLLPGDGRVVAYHALNRGRVLLGAGGAAALRSMIDSLVPWVGARETFGHPIAERELVQRRLGRLAARLVACDALLLWSAQLLDAGYRGELEGVVTKVFCTEAIKEATVDVLLKTHGGRALMDGNLFADEVHELLAPTVFEGENEILTLGFFAALARAHGEDVLQPLTRALAGQGNGDGRGDRVRRAWHARAPLTSYAAWAGRRQVRHAVAGVRHAVPTDLDGLTHLAALTLRDCGLEISSAMRHEGTRLATHQAEAFDLAQRALHATVMLVVSRYGSRTHEPLRRDAAACLAAELGQRLTGTRPTAAHRRLLTTTGAAVAEGAFPVA